MAIPGGLLPNAFSLFFALCKREKIIVFSFLWKILWVMLVCVGQPRFRHLPRVMFMWRKALLPVQVANMGINWICCKFLFGKYSYFMEMSNCIDAKRLVYRIPCVANRVYRMIIRCFMAVDKHYTINVWTVNISLWFTDWTYIDAPFWYSVGVRCLYKRKKQDSRLSLAL